MREFVEYIVKQIVKNPQDITVTETLDGDIYIYNISASPEDMGVLIGKEGRTIRSIRNLVKAKAIKDNLRIQINIVDTQPND